MEPSSGSEESATADGDKKRMEPSSGSEESVVDGDTKRMRMAFSSTSQSSKKHKSPAELSSAEQQKYDILNIVAQSIAKSFCYTESYRLEYQISTHPQHQMLTMSTVIAAIKAYLYAILRRVESLEIMTLVRVIATEWKLFDRALDFLVELLVSMKTNSPQVSSLKEDGVSLWMEIILGGTLRFRCVSRFLPLIHKETDRKREVKDQMFIIDRMRMFVMDTILMLILDRILKFQPLKSYDEDFEECFLDAAASYRDIESQISLSALGIDYSNLEKNVQICGTEETMSVAQYLIDPDSLWKACKIVDRESIDEYLENLLERGGGLSDACDLESMCVSLRNLCSWFDVNEIGRDHLLGSDKSIIFVKRLLDLTQKFDKLRYCGFIRDDESVQDVVHSVLVSLINISPMKIPQFIAIHLDHELRRDNQSFRELFHYLKTGRLDFVVDLIKFVKNKDIFLGYHSNYLKRRLLSEKCVSWLKSERRFVKEVRKFCHDPYLRSLAIMLTDIKKSKDLMDNFNLELCLGSGVERVNLRMRVLSPRAWPIRKVFPCNLPTEMLAEFARFSAFYKKNHPLSSLLCQTNMGNVEVVVHLGNENRRELKLSTYQICILWQFDEADRLTYENLLQVTEISAPELKRNLKSLACETGRSILRREPANNEIGEGDWFVFNENFTREEYIVEKIHTSPAQNDSPGGRQSQHRAEQNRNPQIDAAIMRIMKQRKLMEHQCLLEAVTVKFEGLFLPTPVLIKNRIESLMDRDFLERDSENRRQYRYKP